VLDAGLGGLNGTIEMVTKEEGQSGWRVLHITRSDDGITADIHFIKD
jgi:hypothetical protein